MPEREISPLWIIPVSIVLGIGAGLALLNALAMAAPPEPEPEPVVYFFNEATGQFEPA